MHESAAYFNEFVSFFLIGLRDGFAHVNAALGLIIAFVAAWQLKQLTRVWAMALGATFVHLLAEVMIPVLANQHSLHLPPDLLTLHYWRTALALYMGYGLVIAIFFVIKRTLVPKMSTAGGHAHH